ncbi:hypothetical protein KFE25_004118 [Diacronema lutheri]|uniref:RING-type domain-containing protein n=1 Tax=Diacronema lutheri TaxID=2081491 RepID=A0A8J5WZS5_DIALT|nr:hypothetical protein KFE25_004118 [Diacronema lutheri]
MDEASWDGAISTGSMNLTTLVLYTAFAIWLTRVIRRVLLLGECLAAVAEQRVARATAVAFNPALPIFDIMSRSTISRFLRVATPGDEPVAMASFLDPISALAVALDLPSPPRAVGAARDASGAPASALADGMSIDAGSDGEHAPHLALRVSFCSPARCSARVFARVRRSALLAVEQDSAAGDGDAAAAAAARAPAEPRADARIDALGHVAAVPAEPRTPPRSSPPAAWLKRLLRLVRTASGSVALDSRRGPASDGARGERRDLEAVGARLGEDGGAHDGWRDVGAGCVAQDAMLLSASDYAFCSHEVHVPAHEPGRVHELIFEIPRDLALPANASAPALRALADGDGGTRAAGGEAGVRGVAGAAGLFALPNEVAARGGGGGGGGGAADGAGGVADGRGEIPLLLVFRFPPLARGEATGAFGGVAHGCRPPRRDAQCGGAAGGGAAGGGAAGGGAARGGAAGGGAAGGGEGARFSRASRAEVRGTARQRNAAGQGASSALVLGSNGGSDDALADFAPASSSERDVPLVAASLFALALVPADNPPSIANPPAGDVGAAPGASAVHVGGAADAPSAPQRARVTRALAPTVAERFVLTACGLHVSQPIFGLASAGVTHAPSARSASGALGASGDGVGVGAEAGTATPAGAGEEQGSGAARAKATGTAGDEVIEVGAGAGAEPGCGGGGAAVAEGTGGHEGVGECVICLSEPKSVLLLPCRHLCCCHDCFTQVDKCPVCRTEFDSFVSVHIGGRQ